MNRCTILRTLPLDTREGDARELGYCLSRATRTPVYLVLARRGDGRLVYQLADRATGSGLLVERAWVLAC
jgi:hypothetical protein